MRTNKTKGFTLVEIMIVVAIIGVVASIAIPSFMHARSSAFKNLCVSNLKQIESVKDMWAIEYGKFTGDTPLAADLDEYIKNGTASIKCPRGGTSFDDSYTINPVATNTVCKRDPDNHKL